MIPLKLKAGDEVRIIAPSGSLSRISDDVLNNINIIFSKLKLKYSISKNAKKIDEFDSSSVEERVTDLHEAFLDKNIKAVVCAIGGFNANDLLKHINYNIIEENPKIFCGYSDITVLNNAIYKKTKLITYSSPNFADFGMIKGLEYTVDYFVKCLMNHEDYKIVPSENWSEDPWYKDQENRTLIKNNGYFVINNGTAIGTIIGGNLCTFNLLQGTEYFPDIENSILFIEDDDLSCSKTFDRDLQSLIHQPDFYKVKGIVIGRFQSKSDITLEKLISIIKSKQELKLVPIIANVDFGHTTPQITFPIGGKVELHASHDIIDITVIEH